MDKVMQLKKAKNTAQIERKTTGLQAWELNFFLKISPKIRHGCWIGGDFLQAYNGNLWLNRRTMIYYYRF